MRGDFEKESKERSRSLPSGAEEMLSHQSQLPAEGEGAPSGCAQTHNSLTHGDIHRELFTEDLCDYLSLIMAES